MHKQFPAQSKMLQNEIKSPCEKMLVDKFLERNRLYNDRIIDAISRLGLVSLDVEDASTADELMSLYLSTNAQQLNCKVGMGGLQ